MDDFFKKKICDRCKGDLNGGRTMSMFNEDCICIPCSEKEREHKDYKKAVESDIEEIKRGNYNYSGIGWKG